MSAIRLLSACKKCVSSPGGSRGSASSSSNAVGVYLPRSCAAGAAPSHLDSLLLLLLTTRPHLFLPLLLISSGVVRKSVPVSTSPRKLSFLFFFLSSFFSFKFSKQKEMTLMSAQHHPGVSAAVSASVHKSRRVCCWGGMQCVAQ